MPNIRSATVSVFAGLTAGCAAALARAGSPTIALVTTLAASATMLFLSLRREHSSISSPADHDRRLLELAENGSDVLSILDRDLTVVYRSPSVLRILGYAPDAVPNALPDSFLHPDDMAGVLAALRHAADTPGYEGIFECRFRHADGTWRFMEVRCTNMFGVPSIDGLLLKSRDVTEHRTLERALDHQTQHDQLTGLRSRSGFITQLDAALRRNTLNATCMSVLVVNIKDFKGINDDYGYQAGDGVLREFAGLITSTIRTGDTASRMGTDEFAVLAEGSTIDHGVALAQRLLALLSIPFDVDGREILVKASIGIETVRSGMRADEVLRHAGVAMRRAREPGSDDYLVSDENMLARFSQRRRLDDDLKDVLLRDELALHYQPMVDLKTGDLIAFEALLRWQHPEYGMIPPLDFIPLAEESGEIVPIGAWILRTACSQLGSWQRLSPMHRELAMSVNVSIRQLQDPNFPKLVSRVLWDSGIEAETLLIEITESVAAQDPDLVARQLLALKALGVRIAIDDFGTGYSSLATLRTFPIDVLKIDKSFVDALVPGAHDQAMTKAIIGLAKSLKVDSLAEGIEHAGQAWELKELGCLLGQGYHFARPLPEEAATALLETSERASSVPDIVRLAERRTSSLEETA